MTRRRRSWRTLLFLFFRYRRLTRRQLGTLQDWKIRIVFWSGALAVGLVVQLFAWATNWSYEWFVQARSVFPYLSLLLPPMGLVGIVWLMRYLGEGSQGSGIPQVLVCLKQRYQWLRPAFLSLRVVASKLVLTCLGLMAGASIGREGPSVHVGAALMHQFGRAGNLHQKYVDNALIVAGGAAGVSAAFNAPLAGIVFAIEELAQSFEQRTSGTLIMAIILSGVVVLVLAGHYSYFGHPETEAVALNQLSSVVLVGVLCGLLGGLFSRFLIVGSRALVPYMRTRRLRVALMCGLLLTLLGLLSGGTSFGSGYEVVRDILDQDVEAGWLFPLAKILATLVSYFSGIPGGLFSPSLAAGAGIGAALANHFTAMSAATFTVVAMASFLAGVVQRPITAFVIVLELTGNSHGVLMALMVGAFVATGTSKLVMPTPVYDALGQSLGESWGQIQDSLKESAADEDSKRQRIPGVPPPGGAGDTGGSQAD